MPRMYTEINIYAPAERIWNILTDFESYPHWNRHILKLEGEPRLAERLTMTVRTSDGKEMCFKPRVTSCDTHKELRMQERLLIPGLFDGTWLFRIEPLGEDGVRFMHVQTYSGILSPLFAKELHNGISPGMRGMNFFLKRLAEGKRGGG